MWSRALERGQLLQLSAPQRVFESVHGGLHSAPFDALFDGHRQIDRELGCGDHPAECRKHRIRAHADMSAEFFEVIAAEGASPALILFQSAEPPLSMSLNVPRKGQVSNSVHLFASVDKSLYCDTGQTVKRTKRCDVIPHAPTARPRYKIDAAVMIAATTQPAPASSGAMRWLPIVVSSRASRMAK